MDDESDVCWESEEAVPPRRWRWLDLSISLMDFAAESTFSLARALADVNNAMRAHYNWQAVQASQRQLLTEHDTISLSGE